MSASRFKPVVFLRTLLGWAWLWLAPLPLCWAGEIDVRVDRENIRVGESFTANFQSGSKWITDEPDFSPLQRDFEVRGIRRSQTFRLQGGQSVQENRWQVTLIPRRAGILLIPPIYFGNDRTPERAVQVLQPLEPEPGSQGKVFVEVQAEPLDPYVQAPVLYTVRLFRALQLGNANLSDPKALSGDLRVEKLDASDYKKNLQGIPYRVDELRYMLIPQASGTMEVAPIEFTGKQGRGRQFVFDFGQGGLSPLGADARLVVRRSDPITLQVRAIPAQFPAGAHWMPAYALSLDASWAQQPPQFRAGEPSTRIFRIEARGLYASQLVLPEWQLPEGLRSYSDQPKLEDAPSQLGVRSVREDRLALIPQRPDRYTLPALEVPWWNLQTDQLEYARVPEQQIQVQAAAAVPTAGALERGADLTAAAAPPVDVSAPEPGRTAAYIPVPGYPGYLWMLIAALTAAWLLTLWAWYRARVRLRPDPSAPISAAIMARLRSARSQLRLACLSAQADAAHHALLDWARQRWPGDPPLNLHQLGRRCPSLRDELEALDRARYRSDIDWKRGQPLWQAFCQASVSNAGQSRAAASRLSLQLLHRL